VVQTNSKKGDCVDLKRNNVLCVFMERTRLLVGVRKFDAFKVKLKIKFSSQCRQINNFVYEAQHFSLGLTNKET